ncbi:hypothetical protein Vadar_011065 [Vaccinium darrowii]|uniref:Uncharacterized protein n=1 Tax=Vaccinium darrowii TaxID=229202 RepID=A0ACB7XR73_9ERIC|nr:hypothetical protein Vadar_011065 [Vaccinium darrowii]
MIFPRSFSLVIGIFICFTTFAYGATLLPPDEVEALKEIGKIMGKTNWTLRIASPVIAPSSIRLALKSQDLPGMLPSELVRLPHLQDIDLSRNYLNGTIPPEWGSMKLVNISLLGNRLTGPIPKEFGNISTLANLTVEFNQLSGLIPKELGSLPLLEKLGLEWNERGANTCQGQTTPLSGSRYPGALPPAVAVVKRALSKIKKPVTLLDITALSLLRKDGHPSIYGNSGAKGLDCTHWCIAGVPDTWNEILYHLISYEK